MRKSGTRWSVLIALMLTIGVQGLQAQSQRALEVLHQRLLPLFELAGVVFTDADETRGRLVVGVLDRDIEGLIRARLPWLGVSSASVDVVETEAIFPLATLQDKVRPVVGGLQIHFSRYLCSLGLSARLNGVAGFVTAAHCSTKQGAVDGTQYYQPLKTVPGAFIGSEVVDPPFFKNNEGCPRGKSCRFSDANFSQGASGVDFSIGQIAKTKEGSLEIAGSFTILGEKTATSGQAAHKVGRTTGWTQGTVTNTCANVAVSGSNIVLLCQDLVQGTGQIVAGGDSGSPVFSLRQGTDYVDLLGILWGGNSSGTLFVYSPIANIRKELGGQLQTY